jgi:Helix-turn-helix domain
MKQAVSKKASVTPEAIAAKSTSNWKIEPPFALVPGVMMLDSRLNKNHYRVMLFMLRHANKKGCCWPMQGTIAYILHLALQTVNKAINDLIKFGWLSVCGRYQTKSKWLGNVYQFHIPEDFATADKVVQAEEAFEEYVELDVSSDGEEGAGEYLD